MTDDARTSAPSTPLPSEPARCHIAQFNVGTIRFPLDEPEMADFVAQLEPVNALADGTPGFVWRLVEEGEGDATRMRPAGADVVVNFSVWESMEALWDFVYRSPHLDTMRRRREWFQRHMESHLVMWWIPAGYIPTVAEALERLALLREHGPSPRAFTFSTSYTAAEAEALQAAPSLGR
ncbi:DUF3291 domain-containing protein [Actinomadura litoris]|uniref:DUF3291 domain-containing protein n=1 Tax=Actinomadura litoris TaxID=2678616 RepID=UPI001FA7F237|nr:DUF3291 domain-containing protein [Actinomadura litoris]